MAKTLKQLEEEIRRLKKQVAENTKAKDYLEIWNLQSTYVHYYHIGRNSEVPSLFAQKIPGVTMEIEDSGVYTGIKSIRRFWTEVFDVNRMHRSPGFLGLHMTVNPVIEINKAGTKARGLWISNGYVSLGGNSDNLKQFLCLGKYNMEYVKEDGQWKFFKFNYRITFMCDYQKGWVEEPVCASIAGNPVNRPDLPTTYHMPYSRYRINTLEPPPPEPFDD